MTLQSRSSSTVDRVGTPAIENRWPSMVDRELILSLVEVIEELRGRVMEEITAVERVTGDEFCEETAELRNIVMQLEGLKSKLSKANLH
jgi:hypothetical protein